jgi:predicted nucleic acid-binding protein
MNDFFIAEPPPGGYSRPPLVVDASIVSAIVFNESGSEAAAARLRAYELVAPTLLDYEVANVACNKLARRVLTQETAAFALDNFRVMAVDRVPVNCAGLPPLCERYALTAYDAAYLWLAQAIAAPLATFDKALASAARSMLRSAR